MSAPRYTARPLPLRQQLQSLLRLLLVPVLMAWAPSARHTPCCGYGDGEGVGDTDSVTPGIDGLTASGTLKIFWLGLRVA